MRAASAVGLATILAACTSAPSQAPPAPGAVRPAVSVPAPAPATPDRCGASALQGLVGRPRSEIPVPVDPARQRVACSACPVTLDFRPERLNFFFDATTGVIEEVRCG